MAKPTRTKPRPIPDWDTVYREGTPPWETGKPSEELVRVLDEGLVRPGTALEWGCGTGADAVHLAKRGFEVTAVDASPTALDRAHTRAGLESVAVRFVLGDAFDFARTAEPFDFVYEAGFYHFVRQENLNGFLDCLWRVTRPGSTYLALVGSTEEEADGGPPQVSEEEIRWELGRLFEFVHLRRFRFESPYREEGFLGWSCLMQRPQVVG
ncbi:MAG: class I SAM-dependent methyltransferase [Planctomycetota bacterium]|jgi:SAM-dependent methyltransferase